MKQKVIEVLTYKPTLQRQIALQLYFKTGVMMSERNLRSIFKSINDDFIYSKCDFVVVSNSNGTYKSKDEKDIRRFNKAKIKQAKSLLWSAYNVNKRIDKNKNMSFMEYIEDELNELENIEK